MPGQVIGYVRVSTVDQNPERQANAIRVALGGEPERWFTDHASGGSTARPAVAAMLAQVREQDTALSLPPWTVSRVPWSISTSSSPNSRAAASPSASWRRG